MVWPQSLSEWITLVAALYGAALSTILAIHGFRKERKRVRVVCSRGKVQLTFGAPEEVISVGAVNKGQRPVTITALGFVDNTGQEWQSPQDPSGVFPLPKQIGDGEQVESSTYLSSLRAQVIAATQKDARFKLKYAFARDAEGKEYRVKVPKWLPSLLYSED